MRHLAVFDMAARLHHLEPPNLAQGARGAAYGVLNCILNALFRRARDLDDPVNMVRHQSSSLAVTWPPSGLRLPSDNSEGALSDPCSSINLRVTTPQVLAADHKGLGWTQWGILLRQ